MDRQDGQDSFSLLSYPKYCVKVKIIAKPNIWGDFSREAIKMRIRYHLAPYTGCTIANLVTK